MKNKKISLIALLIGLATITFSQEVKPGPEASSDTARINALLKQSNGLASKDPGKAIEIAIQAKDQAEKVDFKQGFAQATVQMESSLSRKRKANELDDDYDMDKVWYCNRCGKMVFRGIYAR